MNEIEPGDVFTRHPNNPIITVDQLPYRANSVFNPGAGLVGGQTLLLIRVEDLLDPATQRLSLYYGAGDSAIALVTANLDDVLALMRTLPPG